MGRPFVDGDRVAVEWWTTMIDEDEEVSLPGCLLLHLRTGGRGRPVSDPGRHTPRASRPQCLPLDRRLEDHRPDHGEQHDEVHVTEGPKTPLQGMDPVGIDGSRLGGRDQLFRAPPDHGHPEDRGDDHPARCR